MVFACFHVMEITWMTLCDAHDHFSQTNGQPPQRDATVAFVCVGPPAHLTHSSVGHVNRLVCTSRFAEGAQLAKLNRCFTAPYSSEPRAVRRAFSSRAGPSAGVCARRTLPREAAHLPEGLAGR